jgi:hypothetical protein
MAAMPCASVDVLLYLLLAVLHGTHASCAALQNIMIDISDEKPTIDAQLLSSLQRPCVCEELLQLLRQRGSPAAGGRGPRFEVHAWAGLEGADRLCIITDELPGQQQDWGRC